MNTPRPRRLDCPLSGPPVAVLAFCGDGYVKVRSLQSGFTFETLASRLQGAAPNPHS